MDESFFSMFGTGKLFSILCCHLTVTYALRLQSQNVMKFRKIDVVSSKK
jgi:hypothetical protein